MDLQMNIPRLGLPTCFMVSSLRKSGGTTPMLYAWFVMIMTYVYCTKFQSTYTDTPTMMLRLISMARCLRCDHQTLSTVLVDKDSKEVYVNFSV